VAPRPPHPATVVQRRPPRPATVVAPRPPHPATVVQRTEVPPHPATVAQPRPPHPAKAGGAAPADVAQRMEKYTSSTVTEGFIGEFSVQFDGKNKGQIERLSQAHLASTGDWNKIRHGTKVSFQLKGNKRGIELGTLVIVVEEKKEEKKIVPLDEQPWICPYPDCGKESWSWKYITECGSCKRTRPGKDAGMWTSVDGVRKLKPIVWECPTPKCKHRNPEFLDLGKCQACKTREPVANDKTSFWVQATRGRVWRFVSYEYISFDLDASERTTVKEVLLREPEEMKTESTCSLCKGSAHGKGKPLTLMQFYKLDTDDGRASYRRRQLEVLLAINPKCICGLKALPLPERAMYFEQLCDENMRNKFNRARDKILELLGEQGEEELEEEQSGSIRRYEMVTTVDENMLCHVVPLVAGGCFKSPKNIVPIHGMCPLCQWLDALFTKWQSEASVQLLNYIEAHDPSDFEDDFLDWITKKAHSDRKSQYVKRARKILGFD
jgi:hypothetical protein